VAWIKGKKELTLFPEIMETLVFKKQKFCHGPETLDQFFRAYRLPMLHLPEFLNTVLCNLAKESACAPEVLETVFRSYQKKVQIPENLESRFLIIQKFCDGPEILDQFF
jgi:hypothetical protein